MRDILLVIIYKSAEWRQVEGLACTDARQLYIQAGNQAPPTWWGGGEGRGWNQ